MGNTSVAWAQRKRDDPNPQASKTDLNLDQQCSNFLKPRLLHQKLKVASLTNFLNFVKLSIEVIKRKLKQSKIIFAFYIFPINMNTD